MKCSANTLKGDRCSRTAIDDLDVCLAHAPQEVRESKGFGGSQPGAGRPKLPTPAEIARKLIEENVLALQRPYWRTLGYDVELTDDGPRLVEIEQGGAKLHGTSKDGHVKVSTHDDLGAQMAAAEKLQDRVYGRPKQATELTGAAGGPIETVAIPFDAEDRSAAAASLLSKYGHLGVSGSD